MDLIGLTEHDEARLGRLLFAYESGQLLRRDYAGRGEERRDFVKKSYRNDAGETIPAYGLMRVAGMVEVDGEQLFKVVKPNSTFGRLYLVNGPDEVTVATLYGWGTWLWHADYVLYNTAATPAFGESWGPTNDTWTITQHRPGFLIQGGNTGTGAASRVIAMQSVPEIVFGKADAAIAHGASGTVRVYGGATQGSETDTSLTIASCYNYGPDIADEANVSVGWMHGKPYVALMECP